MRLHVFSLSWQLLYWQLSVFDNGEAYERVSATLAVLAAENVWRAQKSFT
jgi:hypothetical protein